MDDEHGDQERRDEERRDEERRGEERRGEDRDGDDGDGEHDAGDVFLDGRHGVVDRIVGDLAVVLIGAGEAAHHLAVADLPAGTAEGDVLTFEYRDGAPVAVGIDVGRTQRRRVWLTERLAAIRCHRGGGRGRRG